LERLPSNEEKSSIPIKSGKNRVISEAIGYMAPVLEEIHLQYNRLEQIPEEIFQLPSLVSLDVSNNKLQSLPYLMWRAAKLKELNASFNLLRELPTTQQGITLGVDVTSLTNEQIMIRSDSFSSQCSLGVSFRHFNFMALKVISEHWVHTHLSQISTVKYFLTFLYVYILLHA
jgi:Leucine-rich repeat (LRR) protein